MPKKPGKQVFDHPPITITCPYCGQLTHMPQPNLDDVDYLMDEDCNSCGERVFAVFEYAPKLLEVYKLVPSGISKGVPVGIALESAYVVA